MAASFVVGGGASRIALPEDSTSSGASGCRRHLGYDGLVA